MPAKFQTAPAEVAGDLAYAVQTLLMLDKRGKGFQKASAIEALQEAFDKYFAEGGPVALTGRVG